MRIQRERRSGRYQWVALALLVLAVGIFFAKILPAIAAAKPMAMRTKAMAQLNSLKTATELFAEQLSRYPTNFDELVINRPGIVFIQMIEQRPTATNDGKFLDPWRRRYLYLAPTAGATGYVASLGADGVVGGVGPDADFYAPLAPVSGGGTNR